MRNLIATIAMSGLFVLHTSFSVISMKHENETGNARTAGTGNNSAILYTQLGLDKKGLSQQAFEQAYKGYRLLLEKKVITDARYLTICDFSQSSREKRLYLIDLLINQVIMNTWVAHGRNSGLDIPRNFSNKPSSLQSSLGFYITKQIYQGAHGLSLRLEGLERGFNDKAYSRAIVIHGADYIGEARLKQSSYMGRSYGCPAVPKEQSNELIETIKDGTCLFIYYPLKQYQKGSKILNG